MDEARLILDPPAEGAWNMAVDQALLETADQTGWMTLRFYHWSAPTLSLGYFQSHLDRRLHSPSQDCPLVRRRTGGGAIVHDHEITYSLSIPSSNRWSAQNTDLYRSIHQIFIDVFESLGIQTCFYIDQPQQLIDPSIRVHDSAFLCFQRRTDRDIVCDGHKIVGSAQRRLKKSLLQHGSILIRRSDRAPELAGIEDVCQKPVVESDLTRILYEELGKRLHIRLVHGKLSPSEKEAAERAFSSHFDAHEWNFRR